MEGLFVQLGVALLAEPHEVIDLSLLPMALKDQAECIGGPLGLVEDPGGQQEHLPLFDGHLSGLPGGDDL